MGKEVKKKQNCTKEGLLPLKRKYLRHLGVDLDGAVYVHKLPGRQLLVRASSQKVLIDMFNGLLAGKSSVTLTIEEISEAIAQAGAAVWEGRDE